MRKHLGRSFMRKHLGVPCARAAKLRVSAVINAAMPLYRCRVLALVEQGLICCVLQRKLLPRSELASTKAPHIGCASVLLLAKLCPRHVVAALRQNRVARRVDFDKETS